MAAVGYYLEERMSSASIWRYKGGKKNGIRLVARQSYSLPHPPAMNSDSSPNVINMLY